MDRRDVIKAATLGALVLAVKPALVIVRPEVANQWSHPWWRHCIGCKRRLNDSELVAELVVRMPDLIAQVRVTTIPEVIGKNDTVSPMLFCTVFEANVESCVLKASRLQQRMRDDLEWIRRMTGKTQSS